jgi:hypothetical protein
MPHARGTSLRSFDILVPMANQIRAGLPGETARQDIDRDCADVILPWA